MSMNSVVLFTTLLLAHLMFIEGANFTCDQCYYSVEHLNDAWNKAECMNNPGSPGVSLAASCREDYYCFVQETFDLNTMQIYEFSRSCSATGYASTCKKDTYHVICRESCRGDYCNRNIVANLHQAYLNSVNVG